VYSFMQSMGMINDHLDECFVHDQCESKRIATLKKMSR
jgi:3-methyladenine DNA glycosylase Tag